MKNNCFCTQCSPSSSFLSSGPPNCTLRISGSTSIFRLARCLLIHTLSIGLFHHSHDMISYYPQSFPSAVLSDLWVTFFWRRHSSCDQDGSDITLADQVCFRATSSYRRETPHTGNHFRALSEVVTLNSLPEVLLFLHYWLRCLDNCLVLTFDIKTALPSYTACILP